MFAGGSAAPVDSTTVIVTAGDPTPAPASSAGSSGKAPLSGVVTVPPASVETPGASASATAVPVPAKTVIAASATPAFGSTDIAPSAPVTVTVPQGSITDFALTNPDGKKVEGKLSADNRTWTLGEVLGYGKVYTAAGTVTAADGSTTPISGTFTTVSPTSRVSTRISPGDGEVVGVAAPVIVKFSVKPGDRALVQKSLVITTTPAVEGSWGWVQHDDGQWAADWRPKDYWPANTVVHVEANTYGVDFGGGNWGGDDLTSDFTIGRNQVVKADVNSHELVVYQAGVVVATYDASYGKGTNEDQTTRSGIHVVSEKFQDKLMSNPKYGYENLLEHWAVRISANGEFIHANPNTVSQQGNTNVSNGCVNLSSEHAEAYFNSAIYGDPVEVTGTDVPLSAKDGDIFDWSVPYNVWQSLSAS
ncbi:L,D-transpeptidase [Nakamurella antarctica]|uniref:L,D-transpeptidase n=2 Tax=Nakamurella antarctica TaxID=1902245 RepID=A0A3G8ZLJ3_9ACTN|nr:L,D-transpeptidase [Nakamurella antarctica]